MDPGRSCSSEASPEWSEGGRLPSSSGLPGINPNTGEMLPGANGLTGYPLSRRISPDPYACRLWRAVVEVGGIGEWGETRRYAGPRRRKLHGDALQPNQGMGRAGSHGGRSQLTPCCGGRRIWPPWRRILAGEGRERSGGCTRCGSEGRYTRGGAGAGEVTPGWRRPGAQRRRQWGRGGGRSIGEEAAGPGTRPWSRRGSREAGDEAAAPGRRPHSRSRRQISGTGVRCGAGGGGSQAVVGRRAADGWAEHRGSAM